MRDPQKLYQDGMSLREVSVVSGIGRWTLQNRFRKIGILRSRREGYRLAVEQDRLGHTKGKRLRANRKFTDAEELSMCLLYEGGISSVAIAERFSCHPTSIQRILKRWHGVDTSKRNGLPRGPRHWNWRGGRTKTMEYYRLTPAYKEWRGKVFERDGYRCVMCGVRGGDLEADHILPHSKYPSLRLHVSNGRTLCVSCHRKTPTFGTKAKTFTTDFFPGP